MKRRSISPMSLGILISLFSCAAEATTPQTFVLGNTNALVQETSAINYITQNVAGVSDSFGHISGMPPNAIGPSTAYAFSMISARIDNGIALPNGCTPATPGGCNGFHQELQFLVQAFGSLPGGFYVAKASGWVSDGVKTHWLAGLAAVVGRAGNEGGRNIVQGDAFKFVWNAPTLDIYAIDWQGNVVQHKTATFAFYANFPPTRQFGPQVSFTMDTSGQFGGCMRDVPNYNDPFENDGHDWTFINIKTLYGHSSPSSVAYMSPPSSNAQCGMFHSPDLLAQVSSVWYQVLGF